VTRKERGLVLPEAQSETANFAERRRRRDDLEIIA
jgi:hypothetical protein